MASRRLLHLVEPSGPGGEPCSLRLLADVIAQLTPFAHDVVVIGPSGDCAVAQACGLSPIASFCPPRHLPLSGRRGLGRLVRACERRRGPYNVIHGWTARSAALATLAVPDRPRIASLHSSPGDGVPSRALRNILGSRATALLTASEHIRNAYERLGIERNRMATLIPGVDQELIRRDQRALLRERWGIEDDTFVIGLLCEPASIADMRSVTRPPCALRLTGRNVALVAPFGPRHRVEAVFAARELGLADVLVFDEEATMPWRIVPGLDAAWCPAGAVTDGGTAMPMLWAMAAGLPVVAERTAAVMEVEARCPAAILVPHDSEGAASDRLAHLYDDREAATRLGRQAATAAREHLDVRSYTDQLGRVYERMASLGVP